MLTFGKFLFEVVFETIIMVVVTVALFLVFFPEGQKTCYSENEFCIEWTLRGQ